MADDLMERAQEAFWAVVAAAHPEITTGDFGPLETIQFNQACETAIQQWVEGNRPASPPPERAYIVTVDVPVMVRVIAEDEQVAEERGDAAVASAYSLMEASLNSLPDIWLGNRYDSTDVGIEDENGDLR